MVAPHRDQAIDRSTGKAGPLPLDWAMIPLGITVRDERPVIIAQTEAQFQRLGSLGARIVRNHTERAEPRLSPHQEHARQNQSQAH